MRDWIKGYVAGLLVTSLLLPGLAATLTMILFLIGAHDGNKGTSAYSWVNSSGTRAWVFGTTLAFAAWLVLAALCRRYGYVDRANPSEYAKLLQGYDMLRARLEAAPDDGSASLRVARAQLDAVGRALGQLEPKPGADLTWAAATGYVALHERLHRSEEALIGAQDPGELIAELRFDSSRIAGSRIASSRELVKRLDELLELVKTNDAASLPEARGGLRRIRKTVNEFRDSRRAGLVRARNNLFGTIIFTAANGYVLLGIALIMGAGATQVLAAAVFYLVGAVVGLFRQLAAAGAADTHSEEDYGLATARLIHTPLFSGLAGVGGVVLTLIALAVTPRPATPSNTATAGTQPKTAIASNAVPSLEQIFDLNNPTAVLIAAIFGLTPSLLMTRLNSNAEKFKVDLRSTEAAESAPGR